MQTQLNLQKEIKYYLKLLIKRRWIWITPIIVSPMLFLAISFTLPSIYEAKCLILIQEKKMVDPLLKNLIISSMMSERISALREQILAWPRLLLLIERLDLDKTAVLSSSPFKSLLSKIKNRLKKMLKKNINESTPREMEALISTLKRTIQIKLRGKELVIISYQGEDPYKTQSLVNTLSDILIEKNVSSQKEDTGSAIDFIKEQLIIYKEKLEKSEKALREFKEIYGDQITKPKYRIDQSKEEEYVEGVTLSQINERLASLEATLVFASVDYTDEYPQIKELKKQIKSLKEKRDQYIAQTAKKIGAIPDEYLDIADSIPQQQETLSRLTRDNDINAQIYGSLLERYETAKITERLDKSSNRTKFKIVEPARFPIIPIKPDKKKFFLFGIAFGFGIGFGIVYLIEIINTTLKHENQLEEVFKYPVLGTINEIKEKDD